VFACISGYKQVTTISLGHHEESATFKLKEKKKKKKKEIKLMTQPSKSGRALH